METIIFAKTIKGYRKRNGGIDMNKSEKEVLLSICQDIDYADDKIDALERLYTEVKRMLKI